MHLVVCIALFTSISFWHVSAAAKIKPSSNQLIDIRYISQPKYSRIVIVLTNAVGVSHGIAPAVQRAGLPMRIYVDLTPCVPLRKWTRQVFALGNDPRVSRLRIGRNTINTARVVLELKKTVRYRISLLQKPMRVVIDLAEKAFEKLPHSSMRLPRSRPDIIPHKSTKQTKQTHTTTSGRPFVLRSQGNLRLPFPFQIKRIAIDAGHGGREEGAVGRLTGLQEKTVTLDIAQRVIQLIRQRKLKLDAFLTRNDDSTMSLDERIEHIKKGRADLVISIHVNAHVDKKFQGISTYLLHWDERFDVARMLSTDPLLARENQGVDPRKFQDVNSIIDGLQRRSNLILSRFLALAIQQHLIRRIHQHYKNIRDLGVRRGLFYLLFSAGVPAIIIEASFISNPSEEKLLSTNDYRQKIALGIVDGIALFLKMTKDSQRQRYRPRTSHVPKK
jgi:N-acetylmuramoyl-L-alanine amidase